MVLDIKDYLPGPRLPGGSEQSQKAETYLRLAWAALARVDTLEGQRRIDELNAADAYLAQYDEVANHDA